MSARLAALRQVWPWYRQQLRRHASDIWGAIAGAVRRGFAEACVTLAIVAGWMLVTYGVAAVLWAPLRPAVWPVSAGLFLLSLAGWRFLGRLAGYGLYALTRDPEEPRRG